MPIDKKIFFFFFYTRSRNEDVCARRARLFSLPLPPPPTKKKTRLDKRREHVLRCARDISHKATREFSHADCASLFLARSTPLTGANATRDISQLHFLPPRVNLHRLFDGTWRNILKRFKVHSRLCKRLIKFYFGNYVRQSRGQSG